MLRPFRRGGTAAIKGLALAVFGFAAMLPAAAQPVARWQPLIAEASVRFGIPVAWIERVMRAESGGRTRLGGRPIVSRAGAMGLMQLMPGTWAEMRAAYGLGDDPHDPRDNILAGTAYLRAMYDRFGYPGMFAAYNAGPGRYARHLATGRPLPAETRAYLVTVAGAPDASATTPPAPSPPTLFAVRREASMRSVSLPTSADEPADTSEAAKRQPRLFVRLKGR
jgi:soluble lytic murein transglycosylase-like protein